ncbi:hypothetical protein WDU94_002835 [Cyamophila willieti]
MDNDLSGIISTVKALEESRDYYACECERLLEKISELEETIDNQEHTHRSDTITIEDKDHTLQTLNREIKSLNNTILLKDTELGQIKTLKREVEELRRGNERLQKDVISLEDRNVNLKDEITKMEETIEEKTNDLIRQETHVKHLQEKIADLRKDVETVTDEKACALRELETLKVNSEETHLELDQVKEKLENIVAAKEVLEDCVKKYQSEIKTIKNEACKETFTNERLTGKVAEMEEEIGKYRREIEQLKDEVTDLTDNLDDTKCDLDKVKVDLKRKTEDYDNYRKTVNNIKQKIITSNRTIGPIRSKYTSNRLAKLRKRRYRHVRVLKNQLTSRQNVSKDSDLCKVGNQGDGNFMKYLNPCQPLRRLLGKESN